MSAYPEQHPESPDVATDIAILKRKVEAGATRAISQFFFDNDKFERYVDRVRAAGIDVPIVPGIVPVVNFEQSAAFAKKAGASVPAWLSVAVPGRPRLLHPSPTTETVRPEEPRRRSCMATG